MTFDPRGNTPGLKLKPNTEGKKIHNMKCRDPKCDSITVVEIEIKGGGGQRLYQCTECGKPLPMNVGGSVNI